LFVNPVSDWKGLGEIDCYQLSWLVANEIFYVSCCSGSLSEIDNKIEQAMVSYHSIIFYSTCI